MKLKMFIADVEIEAEGSEDTIRSVFDAVRLLMNAEIQDEPPVSGRPKTAIEDKKP